MTDIHLGVNIDHIATLRQARGTDYPDPVAAALIAERAGADSITVHLREDRRHIQDRDVEALRGALRTRMNLEMAVTEEMLGIAARIRPAACCLVPEKREELTTEGGLEVAAQPERIAAACAQLGAAGIRVSLFIDPDARQVEAAVAAGAPAVEIHTGAYAEAGEDSRAAEFDRIASAAAHANKLGLLVHAGHGLHYGNVQPVAEIAAISELNIGHSIISRAVFDGIGAAVQEMKRLMLDARRG